MIKIEIGPGPKKIDSSWVTLGVIGSNPAVDKQFEWGDDKIPYDNNSVDLIYASHCLEHVIWHKTVDALKEVRRVLKVGGKLEIHVPDFKKIVDGYQKNRCGDAWRKFNPDSDPMTWVNGRIFTYGGPGNNHFCVFDQRYLTKQLKAAGFSQVHLGAPKRGSDHGVINLAMTAVK